MFTPCKHDIVTTHQAHRAQKHAGMLVQATIQASASPAYLSPQLISATPTPTQHQGSPAVKTEIQASPLASTQGQLSPSPHLSQTLHKQTLQEAHAEARQHFQHAHPVATEATSSPPISPAAYGIYAMVSSTCFVANFAGRANACLLIHLVREL